MYSFNHIMTNVKYVLRVLARKPLFFLRLAKNFIKIPFVRGTMMPLRFADIAVTYNCNMCCKHCSSLPLKKDRPLLSIDDYRKIFDEMAKAGLLVVNFTGGDPFTRKDFFKIIEVMKPKRFLVAVQTNGYAVTREKLEKLKILGVDSINVSIDSHEANEHDSFRNTPKAFEKAIHTLNLAQEMGFNVGISYCLTRQNLYSEGRRKIFELSKEHSAMLNYNLAVPIGFWRGNYDSMLTASDRKYLLELLEKEPNTKTDFETNYYQKGCGAIKEKVYVTAYGDIMPCPFIQINFGNILIDNINSIRRRALKYPYFYKYHARCIAAEDLSFIQNVRCYDPEYNGELPIDHHSAFANWGGASEHEQ